MSAYLAVTVALSGAVSKTQSFQDSVFAKQFLYLDDGFLTASLSYKFGFSFFLFTSEFIVV